MLKIQVLGKGLIPRGLGIAPRKEPFYADFTLICTILKTPGLIVNMIHPDGRSIRLTNANCKSMFEKYRDKEPYSDSVPDVNTDNKVDNKPSAEKPVETPKNNKDKK